MPNDTLILRTLTSPYSDITRGSVLSHDDVDNNFIFLKGETIYTASSVNNQVTFQKLNGNSFQIDLNGSSSASIVSGTYSAGTITLYDNSGATITITGVTTPQSFQQVLDNSSNVDKDNFIQLLNNSFVMSGGTGSGQLFKLFSIRDNDMSLNDAVSGTGDIARKAYVGIKDGVITLKNESPISGSGYTSLSIHPTDGAKFTQTQTTKAGLEYTDLNTSDWTNGTMTHKKYVDDKILTGWSLSGNAGTTSANFLGTTDDMDLFFKRNNTPAGQMSLNSTFWGVNAGVSNTGTFVTAMGVGTATNNAGNSSVFVGHYAGAGNSTNGAVMIGTSAGQSNTGNYATLIGFNAGLFNSFNNVTAIGSSAAADNARQFVMSDGLNNLRLDFSGLSTSRKITVPNANGIFALSVNGYIPDGNGNITVATVSTNNTFIVGSLSAMTGSTTSGAVVGDVTIITGTSTTYILRQLPPSVFDNWSQLLFPGAPVTSVFGRTGAVSAGQGDYTFSQLAATPTTVVGYGITDVPAQFVPIAGTNISLSGTYPTITFHSRTPIPTSQVVFGNGSGLTSNSSVFISGSVLNATTLKSSSLAGTGVRVVLADTGGTISSPTLVANRIYYSDNTASWTSSANFSYDGVNLTSGAGDPNIESGILLNAGRGQLLANVVGFKLITGNRNGVGIFDTAKSFKFQNGDNVQLTIGCTGPITGATTFTVFEAQNYLTVRTLSGASTAMVVADSSGLLSRQTIPTGTINSMTVIGSTPNASGATISGLTLTLQPASVSFGGVVTTTGQTFSGTKTFNNDLFIPQGSLINGLSNVVSAATFSHAEGFSSTTFGSYSHAEGYQTNAYGLGSHAEGQGTLASGQTSHAEGLQTQAHGDWSHSEGRDTFSIGGQSHAEGRGCIAMGGQSHAEGRTTIANGLSSHAEGKETVANGEASHSSGFGTSADTDFGFVCGKYNLTGNTNSLFVVGNGTTGSSRSDAFSVSLSGAVAFNNNYGSVGQVPVSQGNSAPPIWTSISGSSTITAGTYTNGTTILYNSTGGTLTITGYTGVNITGGTYANGITTLYNNTGGTVTITGYTDINVTGGTYANGTTTIRNNTGGTFTITGYTDTFVTGGTYANGTTTLKNNTGGTFTITGYTDVTITGGTYANGTTTLRNNTGGTFNITGYTIPEVVFNSTPSGAAYTLVATDAGKFVETNHTAANTLTIPPNSSVAFPIGTVIETAQFGVGQTTLTAGAGVTILASNNDLKFTYQYSVVTLIKKGTDTWYATGDLTA